MPDRLNRRDFLKLAALFSLAWMRRPVFARPAAQTPADPDSPNVLVLVFDSLTAHNVSLYGYSRETTPNLARFAERATVYHNHRSPANFTSPGTASLLTGTYPWTHRALNLQSLALPEFAAKNLFSLFGARGYHQVAYSHNPLAVALLTDFRESLDLLLPSRDLALLDEQFSDLLLAEDWNNSYDVEWQYFRGGLGEYPPGSLFLAWLHRIIRAVDKRRVTRTLGDRFPLGVPNNNSSFFILEDAIDWLSGQLVSLPAPFLVYHHLLPPHGPYMPRRDFAGRFNDGLRLDTKPRHPIVGGSLTSEQLLKNRQAYDEFIGYVDAEFGRLLDFMEARGVLENTIVVFTSDHGEAFERGVLGHLTPLLYETLLRIPLLISRPGQAAREDVHAPTSGIDVLPTLLHLTGRPVPEWIEGRVLPPFEPADEDRVIYAIEAKSNPRMAPLTQRATIAMIRNEQKLLHYRGYPNLAADTELYDLAQDPAELNDRSVVDRALAEAMRNELQAQLDRVDAPFRRS